MKSFSLFFSVVFLILNSCASNRYQTAAYERLSDKHQVLAVLPSQTIMTGRIPSQMTAEDIQKVEENESFAFQVAIFNEVAERSGSRKSEISIDLQHYSETNAKLEAAGFNLRDSWKMAPTELAKVLGVDAVIRTSVRKDMFLTELESYGVSVAREVLGNIGARPISFLPVGKTSDVFLSATILDAESGITVWNTDEIAQTHWNRQHAVIVQYLAQIMARRFPYRAG